MNSKAIKAIRDYRAVKARRFKGDIPTTAVLAARSIVWASLPWVDGKRVVPRADGEDLLRYIGVQLDVEITDEMRDLMFAEDVDPSYIPF